MPTSFSLRIVNKEDVALMRFWAASPEFKDFFRRLLPVFAWPGDEQILPWFTHSYMIEADGKSVGIIQFANLDMVGRQAELGILIDPRVSCQRRDVAIEACHQAFEMYFGTLGLNRLFCKIMPYRKALAELLTSNGFQIEGTLRENVFWNGEFHDEILLSLLKRDYHGRSNPAQHP